MGKRRLGTIAAACGAVLLMAPAGTGLATAAEPPSVTTFGGGTDRLTAEGAVVVFQGLVRPNGSDTVVWFEYGLTTDYGYTTPSRTVPSDGAGMIVMKEGDILIGAHVPLIPGETYHVRLVATNAVGTVFGDDQLADALAPLAVTRPVADVTDSAATLNAWVEEKGWATSFNFEYGPTTAYGSSTPPQDPPVRPTPWDGAPAVSTVLTGLLPATMYHYRVVVETPRGPVFGQDQDLFTLSAPPVPVLPVASSPAQGATARVAVPKQRLRSALRQGLRSTVTCPHACRVRSDVFLTRRGHRRLGVARRTILATGSAGTQRGGTVPVTARFLHEAKRTLAGSRRVRLVVRTSIRDEGGATRTTRSFVTLGR